MNDTIFVIILFLLLGLGLCKISQDSDHNLRPSKAKFCGIERIGFQGCYK